MAQTEKPYKLKRPKHPESVSWALRLANRHAKGTKCSTTGVGRNQGEDLALGSC